MEKEELLTKVQSAIGKPDAEGNYGEVGISGRTLDAYLDGILPTLGEEVTDELIGAHANILKSMGGQMRHEKAEFVKNYKPKQQPMEKTEDGSAEEIKQLHKQMTELMERLNRQDTVAKQERLKESVLAGMRAKNATDEYVLKNCLKGVELDSGKNESDLVDECLKLYDAEYKACRGGNDAPRLGNNGGGGANSDIDTFFEEMKKRGKI